MRTKILALLIVLMLVLSFSNWAITPRLPGSVLAQPNGPSASGPPSDGVPPPNQRATGGELDAASKLNAPLKLAFHLWNEQTQVQRQAAEIELVEKASSQLAKHIDLHLDAPEPGVNVLVQTTDDARELEAKGIQVQARIGDVATAYIPFSRLLEIAALPSVVSIEASQILEPLHDISVPETGAPQVWNTHGVTGTGVIVGVIDSGIDPFHPDFINPDGTTRIKYLLDLSDPGDRDSDGNLDGSPATFGGTMYTEAQINAALANPGWFYRSTDTPLSIPDNSSTGTTSQINVTQWATISSVAIDLYVSHTYVGDLRVILTCPSGTQATLHNRTGGRSDNIIGTFTVTACNGESATGIWRLTVSDHALADTGRLIFWNLHLNRSVRMTDLMGHGAHVAGSAAGNGRATGGGLPAGTFKGMAPGANLIAVRATRNYIGGFAIADIVNALSFIDQKAGELGMPYVVNMSLGGHIGPHDGTSAHERAIDNLVGAGKPGKAVVVAAGNEGDRGIHASGNVSQGGTATLQVTVPSGGGFFIADIWYEGSDTFGVGFRAPNGYTLDPASGPTPGNQACYNVPSGSVLVAIVCIAHTTNNPNNGDKEVLYQVISLLSGTWQLTLRGNSVVNGRYDGWIQGCCAWVNPDNQMRVGMPGTARNAITVGAYTTKNQWIDVTGANRSIPATVGAIAAFSSDGPTRDGRLKPEIAAPGQMICSTLSDQSPAGGIGSMYPDNSYICRDGRHGISPGTSMAAPHVSGAVALLLSRNRNMDAIELRNALTGAARSDSYTGAVPNNRWGYGKLNVMAAFRAAQKVHLPLVLRNYAPTPDDPTPTPTPTPTPSNWVTIISEDFEGDFPGAWMVYDNNRTTNGEYYWGKRTCRPFAGSYSGWAVGAGANGAGLSCGSNYPNNAQSSMEYGPFSLVGATAAELKFKLWLNTESDYDYVCRMASINGTDFYGSCDLGYSGGWVDRTLDLSNVYILGNLLGQPQVWVLLWFYSDSTFTYAEGAYVDNIVLRKCPAGATCPAGGAQSLPEGSQLGETQMQIRLP